MKYSISSIYPVRGHHILCKDIISIIEAFNLFEEWHLIDRELARFIYVREVKRFDPFKFSIYAWCIKIAIAGSHAPVRLAWVPFLRVPKNGFIYVEADTKKLYAGL